MRRRTPGLEKKLRFAENLSPPGSLEAQLYTSRLDEAVWIKVVVASEMECRTFHGKAVRRITHYLRHKDRKSLVSTLRPRGGPTVRTYTEAIEFRREVVTCDRSGWHITMNLVISAEDVWEELPHRRSLRDPPASARID